MDRQQLEQRLREVLREALDARLDPTVTEGEPPLDVPPPTGERILPSESRATYELSAQLPLPHRPGAPGEVAHAIQAALEDPELARLARLVPREVEVTVRVLAEPHPRDE